MSITEVVKFILTSRVEVIEDTGMCISDNLEHSLAEAERLSDMFADVRPVPYIVPMERYYGFPVVGEARQPVKTQILSPNIRFAG
jgi:hypothetical protein